MAARKGRLELADGGTLFLDEVGEIPLDTQVKLLRAIEQKAFERVGGNATLRSDFRVIAATHRDLPAMVKQGRFREDLYFRLAVFPLGPAAAARAGGDDAVLLARHFLARRAGGRELELSGDQEARLRAYPWPGNVRELQNVVERAVLLSGGELRLDLALPRPQEAAPAAAIPAMQARNLSQQLESAEKSMVSEALRQAGGNQSQAAKLLGLERTTLQYKMKKHGLLLVSAMPAAALLLLLHIGAGALPAAPGPRLPRRPFRRPQAQKSCGKSGTKNGA